MPPLRCEGAHVPRHGGMSVEPSARGCHDTSTLDESMRLLLESLAAANSSKRRTAPFGSVTRENRDGIAQARRDIDVPAAYRHTPRFVERLAVRALDPA